MSVDEYLDAHKNEILREVLEFASIPGISTDATYKGGVARAARWVLQQLGAAGPFTADIF